RDGFAAQGTAFHLAQHALHVDFFDIHVGFIAPDVDCANGASGDACFASDCPDHVTRFDALFTTNVHHEPYHARFASGTFLASETRTVFLTPVKSTWTWWALLAFSRFADVLDGALCFQRTRHTDSRSAHFCEVVPRFLKAVHDFQFTREVRLRQRLVQLMDKTLIALGIHFFARGQLRPVDLVFGELLDGLEPAALTWRHQRDSDSFTSGASGTPNTVNVILGV